MSEDTQILTPVNQLTRQVPEPLVEALVFVSVMVAGLYVQSRSGSGVDLVYSSTRASTATTDRH